MAMQHVSSATSNLDAFFGNLFYFHSATIIDKMRIHAHSNGGKICAVYLYFTHNTQTRIHTGFETPFAHSIFQLLLEFLIFAANEPIQRCMKAKLFFSPGNLSIHNIIDLWINHKCMNLMTLTWTSCNGTHNWMLNNFLSSSQHTESVIFFCTNPFTNNSTPSKKNGWGKWANECAQMKIK